MKLGLIARADNTGLGIQTWEFYRHMQPAKTLVVDISKLNKTSQFPDRFKPKDRVGQTTLYVEGFPDVGVLEDFLNGLDAVFIAESPYNYDLYRMAKDRGVKTACQYNYEFFDWFAWPQFPTPDMLIAPSKWNYDKVQEFADQRGIKHEYLHCPVNREVLPFQKKQRAHKFLHIAGRTAAHDRNGTKTVIEASKYLKSDAEIVIHFQGEQGLGHQATHDLDFYRSYKAEHGGGKITMQEVDFENYWDIYNPAYDVLILPRRYGGNCLQLNEALSRGMPAIMPNISPNNEFLAQASHWLVPAKRVSEFKPRMVVDIYEVDPRDLAAKIDELATSRMFRFENEMANKLAQSISWQALKPEYERVLRELCTR